MIGHAVSSDSTRQHSQHATAIDIPISQTPLGSVSFNTSTDSEHLRQQSRLLLVALLENFCSLYNRNPAKNHHLFLLLCRKLSSMGILNSLDFVDDAVHVRNVYKKAFRDLVHEAIRGIEDGNPSPRLIAYVNERDDDDDDRESTALDDALKLEKSRYHEDFIENSVLGKGGFGKVFRALNKLEGKEYAIKKIPFSLTRHLRAVREVKSLATLDHVNIVRYNSAWIEQDYHGDRSFRDNSDLDSASVDMSQAWPVSTGLQSQMTMYIQMELCHFTLSDWILERNRLIFGGSPSSTEPFSLVPTASMVWVHAEDGVESIEPNSAENRRVFKAIVKGLEHIHANQMIHRDLKPQNIFFKIPDLTIKIGDFGLVSGTGCIGSEPCSSGTLTPDLTTGLGTAVYASPEQLKKAVYDERADIFSLGIVCFEIFYPMQTLMEKSAVLTELRENKRFPEAFLKKYPKEPCMQAAFIWFCLASDPSQRPSAKEILDIRLLDPDLDEDDIRRLLKVYTDENRILRQINVAQAKELEMLRQRLAQIQMPANNISASPLH